MRHLLIAILGTALWLHCTSRAEFMDCSAFGSCNERQLEQLNKVLDVVNEDILKKQEDTNTDTYIDGKKVATAEDMSRAYSYAMEQMCNDRSYKFIPNSDGGVCVHTYQTCMRDSKETGDDYDLQYTEWRGNREDVNRCVYAYSGYKQRCEDDGLTYDEDLGRCKTNKRYCECKGLEYKNGDCWRDPMSVGFGTVFGNTITQGTNKYLSHKAYTHGCA